MDFQTIEMVPTGDKDIFEATVAAEQINPKWDFMYFINVMDNEKHGIIYPDLNRETPYIVVNLVR